MYDLRFEMRCLLLQAAVNLYRDFMLDNIIKILRSKGYLALAVFSAIVMTLIYAIFTNLTMGVEINPLNGVLTITMAILSGIYLTVFIYNQKENGTKKYEKAGLVGMFIGFFTSAAPYAHLCWYHCLGFQRRSRLFRAGIYCLR
jgi:hypothetical protein